MRSLFCNPVHGPDATITSIVYNDILKIIRKIFEIIIGLWLFASYYQYYTP